MAARKDRNRKTKTNHRADGGVRGREGVFSGNMALEPRLMFDGAGMASFDMGQDAAHDAARDTAHDGAHDGAGAMHDAAAGAAGGDADALVAALSGMERAETANDAQEIVFIDAAVEGRDALAAAMGPGVEVVLLDGDSDGVKQMAEALAGRENVEVVHILSHGRSGTLDLGTTKLTAASAVNRYADEMAVIRDALSENADILIYGCDFARGVRGRAAVETLAELTGADIAASSDLTGAADRGGDWDLEVREGAIEAATLSFEQWRGLLAALPIQIQDNSLTTRDANGNVVSNNTVSDAGATAVWTNVGTINGASVDLRATVVDIAPNTEVQFTEEAPRYDDLQVIVKSTANGNDHVVRLRWELIDSATGNPVSADVAMELSDLDGRGGQPYSREVVGAALGPLSSYVSNEPTNVVVDIDNGTLFASGTVDQNYQPQSAIKFEWASTSSWELTYTLKDGTGYNVAAFWHDADGDGTVITNPQRHSLTVVDLDGDDSSGAAGNDYERAYVVGHGPVAIADADVNIENGDPATIITGATVRIANAAAGDTLVVGDLPAGITATVNAAGTEVTLSGDASMADYQAALHAIAYANADQATPRNDRTIEVVVSDANGVSNTAKTTITLNAADDFDGDGIANDDDLDDDNDGILDVDEGYVPPQPGSAPDPGPDLMAQAGIDGSFESLAPYASDNSAQNNYYYVPTGWQSMWTNSYKLSYWKSPMPTTGSGTSDLNNPGYADGMPSSDDGGTFLTGGKTATTDNDGEMFRINLDAGTYTFVFYQAHAGIDGTTPLNDMANWQFRIAPANAYNSDQNAGTVVYSDPMPYLGEGNQVWERKMVVFTVDTAGDYDVFLTTGPAGGQNVLPAIDGLSLHAGDLTQNTPPTPAQITDSDGDGLGDHMDLDSDNDGISDLIESGQDAAAVDTDNDGMHDGAVNADGVPLAAGGGNGVTPVDTDGDGIADKLDLDSDNDGIPDAVEARPTAGYVSSTHADNDAHLGVNDDGLYLPQDTDNDGTFDFRDTDSDGDGLTDAQESGITAGADNDGDGIGDGVGASYADPDGNINAPSASLNNEIGDTTEVAYRETAGNQPPKIDLDVTPGTLPGSGDVPVLTFTNPIITNDGQDETTYGAGNGETALYQNVGTLADGTQIDIRATVVWMANPGRELTFGTSGTGARVLNNSRGEVEIRWEVLIAGTDKLYAADLAFVLFDIDYFDANRYEQISIDKDGLDSYTVNGDTDIVVTENGNYFDITATDADPGGPGTLPDNAVQINFSGVNRFMMKLRHGQYVMRGDTTTSPFTNPTTVDVNPDYGGTFVEGKPPIPIAEQDMQIVDDGQLTNAVITLTNPQAADRITIDPALLPAGITLDPASSDTSIILNGTASPADYEAAIKAIRFENTSDTPDETTVREITVQVTDDANQTSNIATARINAIDMPPDTDGDGITDDIDLDDDNDGILDVDEVLPAADWSITASSTGNGDQQAVIGAGHDQVALTISTDTGRFSGSSTFAGIDYLRISERAADQGRITITADTPLIDPALYFGSLMSGANPTLVGDFTVTLADGRVIDNADFEIIPGTGGYTTNGSANQAVKTVVNGKRYIHDPSADTNQGYALVRFTGLPQGVAITGISFDVLGNDSNADIFLLVNAAADRDTDADGVVNRLDLDSDNDGISDLIESGQDASAVDTDNSGRHDGAINSDGVPDDAGGGVKPVDTDGDGIADTLDLDSDNDGIPDAVEAMPTSAYTSPGGGQNEAGVNATGLKRPVDIDADGTFDFRDVDSDNDGISDSAESGLNPGADNNNDGIGDGVGASYADPDGNVNDPSTTLANEVGDNSEVAYREPLLDSDGDGKPDAFDLDDDNDGILDKDEIPAIGNADSGDGANGRCIHWLQWDGDFNDGFHVGDSQTHVLSNGVEVTLTVTAANDHAADYAPHDMETWGGAQLYRHYNTPSDNEVMYATRRGLSPEVTFAISAVDANGNPVDVSLIFSDGESTDSGERQYATTDGSGWELVEGFDNYNAQGEGTDTLTIVDTENGVPIYISRGVSTFTWRATPEPGADPANGTGGLQSLTLGICLDNWDTDGDGVPDRLDLDSDNDGISDLRESGQNASVVDTDNDGRHDGGVDGDGVPLAAGGGAAQNDSDGDGIADRIDLDSDNDGIPDAVEARPTAGYVSSTHLDNATNSGVNDDGLYVPVDTDNDGTPDWLDTDSDNDGDSDATESGLAPGADGDGDGIGDGIGASYADPDGDVNDPSTDLRNQFGDTTEVAYREDGAAPSITNDPDNSSGAGNGDFVDTYTENDPPIRIVDTDAQITDPNGDITELVVTLTDGKAGDAIIFPSQLPGGITANVQPGAVLNADGTLTVTFTSDGNATVADWNQLLQSLTFEPSRNTPHAPDPADRHFTFVATDSAGLSSAASHTTIHVVPVNDPPYLDLDDDNSGGINAGDYLGMFTEDAGPVPIHSNIVINDLDDTNMEQARVKLTNAKPGDQLLIDGTVVQPGDSGTFRGISYRVVSDIDGSPIIEFSGSAAIVDYKAALEAVSFNNTSDNPDTTRRVIDVVINDGDDPSETQQAYIDITPVNDPPRTVDPTTGQPAPDPIPDVTTTDGATPAAIDLNDYIVDPDGDALTWQVTGLPAGLSLDPATGRITGTLDRSASQGGPNGDGIYEVSVTATDPSGESVTTTFTYTVTNPAPEASDDTATTDEDTPVSGNVLPNDHDGAPDSDPLHVAAVGGDAAKVGQPVQLPHGELVLNADGSWTYQPNEAANALAAGETATDTITYTVSDGEGGTAQATLRINITGSNDGPKVIDPTDPTGPRDPDNVIDDVVTTDGATPDPVDASEYLVDPDGDALTFTATGLPAGLTIDPQTGRITGQVDRSASQGGPNGDGVHEVVITATDPSGETASTTVTYTVTNPAPVAVDDDSSGSDHDPQSGNLLANDHDGAPDSDPLSVTGVAGGQPGQVIQLTNGALTVNADGTWTFQPNDTAKALKPGETATEQVSYTIFDGEGGTATATLTITIVGDNDGPKVIDPTDPTGPGPQDPDNVIDDVTTTDGATPAVIDASEYLVDPEGDQLTFTATGLPEGLSIDPQTGRITGTIDHSASQGGPNGDGVYDVVITATDPAGESVSTTVTYTVANVPPEASDDAATTDEDTPVSGNVLPNDHDGAPDSDPLSVTGVSGGQVGQPIQLAHGELVLNADGSWTYQPNENANGLAEGETVTDTVSYTISDGEGGTATARLAITITGSNDAPVIVDPTDPGDPKDPKPAPDPAAIVPPQELDDGETITPFELARYVVDPDGDTLTWSATGLPAGLSIDPATGTVTGTVDRSASQGGPNGDGVYPVAVTISDGKGGTTTLTTTVTVSNPAPEATDDAATTDEDTPVSGNVLPNDHDGAPDSDPLHVAAVGGDAAQVGQPVQLPHGELVLNADGTWTFTPNAAANALDDGETVTDTITYTVSDGEGGTATAQLAITITGSDDGPQVIDPTDPTGPGPQDPENVIPDVVTTDGATPDPVDASQYLVDPEGDALTFTATGLPEGLTIDPQTGVITGTIGRSASQRGDDPVNARGVHDVVITATDPATGKSASTTVTYTVTNPAPEAADDAATTDEDTAITGDVLPNDQDAAPDSDSLHVSAVNGLDALVGQRVEGSTGGTFVIREDGSWSFDPGMDFQALNEGESRQTSITYQVSDGEGGFDTATLVVTVTGTNDGPTVAPPAARRDVVDGETIDPVDISASVANPTGQPLTYTATGLPEGLTIDPQTGVITGTIAPDASVKGPYHALITVSTPQGEQTTVSAIFNVSNVDPQAQDDRVSTPRDTKVIIDVLANDADGAPDSDPLAVTGTTTPAHGTVTINADGTVDYVPTYGFTGTDTFEYTVSDGQGGTATATVTVVVGGAEPGLPTSGPIPPEHVRDGETISPIDVSEHFEDPTGQPLTFTATGLPKRLTIDPQTGVITGTVDKDASEDGPYTVKITATDPDGNHTTQELVISVENPAPQAQDDATTTSVDTPVTLNVLGNDSDPDGDDIHVAFINEQPANGTVSINPDGTITYTPNPGYVGKDTFTYIVEDANGGRAEATVTIGVATADPGMPTAEPLDPVNLEDGQTISPIDVSDKFEDPTGQPLTYQATGLPKGLTIDPQTGKITGTVDKGASEDGPYQVLITATDEDGNQVSQVLTIDVSNPAPQAVDDITSTRPGTPVQIGVLSNDHDPDGDDLTVSIAGQPGHGTVEVRDDGSIVYTPDEGFTGEDVFTYTITDEQGATSTATVTINVDEANGGSGSGGGAGGGGLTPTVGLRDVMTEDSATPDPLDLNELIVDPEGDRLTFTVTGLPEGLTFDPATGRITGQLHHSASQGGPNGDGIYPVKVVARDPGGNEVTQTFRYVVSNVPPENILPIDDRTARDGQEISIPTAPHFTDRDGDDLTYTATGLPEGLTIDPRTGVISGTMSNTASRSGPYEVTVTVDDGEGGTAIATFTIDARPMDFKIPPDKWGGKGDPGPDPVPGPRPTDPGVTEPTRDPSDPTGPGGRGNPGPIIGPMVEKLRPLGGKGLPTEQVITATVKGMDDLVSTASLPENGAIHRVVRWLDKVRERDRDVHANDLTGADLNGDGKGHAPYLGHNLNLSLGNAGLGQVHLGTVVAGDGTVIVDISDGAGGAVRGVTVIGAPDHVMRLDERSVLINVPAGRQHEMLRIIHKGPDGAMRSWDVRIDLHSGEVKEQGRADKSAAAGFFDQVERLAGTAEDETEALLRALA